MTDLPEVTRIAAEAAGITERQANRFLEALASQNLGRECMAAWFTAPRKVEGQNPFYADFAKTLVEQLAHDLLGTKSNAVTKGDCGVVNDAHPRNDVDAKAINAIRDDERRRCAEVIEDWIGRIKIVNGMAALPGAGAEVKAMAKPQEQIDLLQAAVIMILNRRDLA